MKRKKPGYCSRAAALFSHKTTIYFPYLTSPSRESSLPPQLALVRTLGRAANVQDQDCAISSCSTGCRTGLGRAEAKSNASFGQLVLMRMLACDGVAPTPTLLINMDKDKIAKLQAMARIGSFALPVALRISSCCCCCPYSSLADVVSISYLITDTRSLLHHRTSPSLLSRTLSFTGGKGTPRRKVIKKSVASTQADDNKLQAALKKLNVAPIQGVEEVNMFKEDGTVLHFSAPKGSSFGLVSFLSLAMLGERAMALGFDRSRGGRAVWDGGIVLESR